MFVKVLTPPAIEAITLDEARMWLRIDVPGFSGDTGQDSIIRAAVRAAREHCEREIDYSICKQTLIAAAPSFYEFMDWPRPTRSFVFHENIYSPYWVEGSPSQRRGLVLPRGPVRAIDSITYIDATTGDDATIDASTYRVALDGSVQLKTRGASWPSTSFEHECVRVTYSAGYEVPGDRDVATPAVENVGADVTMAMRLLVGHFYINRSASVSDVRGTPVELPLGVTALLRQSRASIGI